MIFPIFTICFWIWNRKTDVVSRFHISGFYFLLNFTESIAFPSTVNVTTYTPVGNVETTTLTDVSSPSPSLEPSSGSRHVPILSSALHPQRKPRKKHPLSRIHRPSRIRIGPLRDSAPHSELPDAQLEPFQFVRKLTPHIMTSELKWCKTSSYLSAFEGLVKRYGKQ